MEGCTYPLLMNCTHGNSSFTNRKCIWAQLMDIASIMSILALILILVWWMSSYGWLPFYKTYHRWIEETRPSQDVILYHQNGLMCFEKLIAAGNWRDDMAEVTHLNWRWLRWTTFNNAPDVVRIYVYHWVLAIPPVAILTLWLILYFRSRIPPGHCSNCRYDLTGTLAAGRTVCPECGVACLRMPDPV